MAKFGIKSAINKNPIEILKTFNYKLTIPNLGSVVDNYDDDIFSMSIIDTTLPNRTNEPIITNFMSQDQRYSGRTTFAGSITCTTELREDLRQIEILYQWQQAVNSTDTGFSSKSGKVNGYGLDSYLILYKTNGQECDKKYKLYNSWVNDINETSLSFATGESVKVPFTLTYDHWELV